MKEGNILKLVMMRAGQIGSRLFRNQVGIAYAGRPIRVDAPKMVMMHPGDVLVKNAYTVTCGLGTGSSDAVGWTPVLVTPDMVGTKVALFTAIETKRPKKSHTTDEQLNFIRVVRAAGGIAGIATSPEEAEAVILSRGQTNI